MENILKSQQGLSRNTIKYMAIIAMLLDHIAVIFMPKTAVLYFVFRSIGRIAAPVMAYFLSEGWIHTGSKKKYILRMAIFAFLSQYPFDIAFNKSGVKLNILFTLLIGLLIFALCDKIKEISENSPFGRTDKPADFLNIFFEFILPLLILFLSILLLITASCLTDWSLFVPLWCLAFYLFRDEPKKKFLLFIIILFGVLDALLLTEWMTGSLTFSAWKSLSLNIFSVFAIPLLLLYDGKKEKSSAFNKWFFYIFYPAHLLILSGIEMMV